MTEPFAPPRHDASAGPPAGWYADPADPTRWRWWDGIAWTAHSAAPRGSRRPRLPRWLSPPVLVCSILVGLGLVVVGIQSPWAVVAGLIPLVIVLPALRWLDRVEPEPLSSRVHAVLWGASVAILVSLIVNTVVALTAGETAAMAGTPSPISATDAESPT